MTIKKKKKKKRIWPFNWDAQTVPFDPKKSVNNSYLLVFFFFSTKKSCVLMYFCYNMPIIVVSYRTLIQYLKKGLASLQTNFNVANIYIIISIVSFCDVTTRNFFFLAKWQLETWPIKTKESQSFRSTVLLTPWKDCRVISSF